MGIWTCAVLVLLAVLSVGADNQRRHRAQDQEQGQYLTRQRPIDFAPKFSSQRDYIYEWNTQLATGLNAQAQHAVQRLRALIRVVFSSENSAIAQLKKLEFGRVNDETHDTVTRMLPFQSFQLVDVPKRHIDKLEKPFEISYKEGRIVGLTFSSEDDPWSENIKRAAANHLQIQLDSDESQLSFRNNETTIEGECESIYTVVPSTSCATVEQTQGQRYFKSEQQQGECVMVTKSIDFAHCKQRPDLRYNFYRGEQLTLQQGPSEPTQREQRVLDQSTITQLELKREHTKDEDPKYTLRFSRTISQYTQPLTRDTSMVAVVVNEMKLKSNQKQSKDSKSPELPGSRKTAETLAHSLDYDRQREKFMEDGDEEYLKQQPYLTERHVTDVVINIVKRLSQSFIAERGESQRIDFDGAQQFGNLVKMLRHASPEELEEIEQRLAPKAAQEAHAMAWLSGATEFVRQILLDGYASAATQPTVKRLFEKMTDEKRELTDTQMAAAFRKLARTAPYVGQQLLRQTWDTCGKFDQQSEAKRACLLSWARMGHVMCQRRNGKRDDNEPNGPSDRLGDEWAANKNGDNRHCSDSFKKELTGNAQKLFDDAKDDSEQRVLALKVYGNLGVDSAVQKLEEVINDRQLSRLDRVLAIDALRNMADDVPHKIRRMLTPLFMDKREHPEVRMNALHQLLASRPTQGTIDQIGTAMLREPNANVRAFTATALRNKAKVLDQIDPQAAKQMRATAHLFRNAPSEQAEQTRRATSRWNAWQLPGSMANFVRAAAIVSNDSRLPKEVQLALDSTAAGHFLPSWWSVGVHQQNLEQLVGDIVEKFAEHQAQSTEIFVRRGKRSALEKIVQTPVQTLKNLYQKMKIVARGSGNDNANEQPTLIVYKREQNMDTGYALMDQKHMPKALKDLIESGQIDLSAAETSGTQPLRWTDASMLVEQRAKVPTTAGVPLVYSMEVAKVSAMSGEWSLEVGGQATTGTVDEIRATLRSLPKLSMRAVQQLEAYSPIHTTAVRTQHTIDTQAPIHLAATYTGAEGLQLDFNLPDTRVGGTPHRVLHATSHPSTLYRAWPDKSRVYVEHEQRTLYLPQLHASYTPIEHEHRCPLSGVRVEMHGNYHRATTPEAWMLGENVMDIHMHVDPSETAKTVRFQLKTQKTKIPGSERQPLQASKPLQRVFEDQTKSAALFAGAEPTEVQMLRERIQRHDAHTHRIYEITARAQALQRSNGDATRDWKLAVKTMCDREAAICSTDAEMSAMHDKQWRGHIVGHMARPTLTGVHGSIRSEHALAHVEAEWQSAAQGKNVAVVCAYGRPSDARVQQWLALKNLRSEERQQNAADFRQMDESEYDSVVLKQTPTSLKANHWTAVVEHQLTPETMRAVQPYVTYVRGMVKPMHLVFVDWLTKSQTAGGQQSSASQLHGTTKLDVTMDERSMRVQVNDITHNQQMPGRSPWTLIDNNEEDDYEQQQSQRGSMWQGLDNLWNDEDQSQEKTQSRLGQGQRGMSSAMRGNSGSSWFGDNNREAQCMMDRDFNVQSFDGKRYKIPLSTCYTIMAKDCGSSDPKFALLVKKQSEQNEKPKIKLMAKHRTQSKSYVMYEQDDKMVIEADGTRLKEDELQRYGIMKITEHSRPLYVFHCRYTGMELRFDGRMVLIKLTDDYLNKQCGICGHYNMNSEDTLRKQDNQLTDSLKEFHDSYLYRGSDGDSEDMDGCTSKAQDMFNSRKEDEYQSRPKFSGSIGDSDELLNDMNRKNKQMLQRASDDEDQQTTGQNTRKNNMNRDESDSGMSDSFDSDYEIVEPRMMTRIHEEHNEICFSHKPMKTCPSGSQPIDDRSQQNDEQQQQSNGGIGFVCLDRNAQANKLKRQVRENGVAEDLKDMNSNKLMSVREHKRCSRQKSSRSMFENDY